MAIRKPKEPSVHVEEQIYNGFTSTEDQAIMAEFHEVPWSERVVLLERISDARLQVLGERLLYTEAPEVMLPQGLRGYQADAARRAMAAEGTVPWLTLPRAIRETDDLLADSTGGEAALLKGLREYLVNRSEEAEMIMA